MHELLNDLEYEPPDLGKSFKESTPAQAVSYLKSLGPWRRFGLPDLSDEGSSEKELFDEDGFFIGVQLSPEDEAWYCD